MKPPKDIKRMIENLSDTTDAQMDQRVRENMLHALEESDRFATPHESIIRRLIMKNSFTKMATAAAILIAVALSITLLNQTTAPAWAIEQTIEALNSMKVVHLSGYVKYPDQPTNTFEIWAAPHSTDASASGNFKLIEADHHIAIANEEQNTTYVYTHHQRGNVVYITDGLNRGCTPLPMGDLFKQLKQIGRNWKEKYGKDDQTGRDSVFVTLIGPPVNTACYWKVQFDVQTKLPISAGVWWSEDYGGEPHFDYTSIEYAVELPQDCFVFNIQESMQVVDCRQLRQLLDKDSNYGIAVAEMSSPDACKKVVEEYWKAVIDNNWEQIKRIRPLATGNALEKLRALYDENQPVELLNIANVNHLGDPGTFAEVTCIVKMKDGSKMQSVLNVEIRQTSGGRIGVIAGSIMGELTATD